MMNLMLGLMYFSYTFAITDAAIHPQNQSHEVISEEDFTIEWIYDNEESMFIVTWTFKNSTNPNAITVMTQLTGAKAQTVAGYNIDYVQNGTITLNEVTKEDTGIYYCIVTYTGASGLSPVTGTATIELKEDSTEEEKSQCEAGCIAGVTAGCCCACLAGAGVGGYVYKKKKKGKGDKKDTSRDVESTRSSPEKAENKLLNKEKQSSATGKADGGNKGKHVSDTQIHLDKSQKVHPENEEKLFRPQPLPPPGAKLNHSLAEDEHETGAHDFSRTKLPPILQNT